MLCFFDIYCFLPWLHKEDLEEAVWKDRGVSFSYVQFDSWDIADEVELEHLLFE